MAYIISDFGAVKSPYLTAGGWHALDVPDAMSMFFGAVKSSWPCGHT
jgi:hypothetical protein